jgi:hypothetical protein
MTESRVGLGCMRLSTEPDRSDANGLAVIHAALDAGIRLAEVSGGSDPCRIRSWPSRPLHLAVDDR